MSGKQARRRRREQTIKLLEAVVENPDLAQHMYDNQVAPQELARDLQEQGIDVDVRLVNTDPNYKGGFEITCHGCGRTARLPHDPGAKVGLCPICQRK